MYPGSSPYFVSQASIASASPLAARCGCQAHVTSDASGLRLVLEPFCERVTLDPPCPELIANVPDGKFVVPPNNPVESSHHYIHLRPGDTVLFENNHMQVHYSLQGSNENTPQADMPPAISSNDEDVQVKSSDPNPQGKEALQGSISNSETEDEGDPDRTTTPMNLTPATSRPTATKEVKETPKHRDVNKDDAPFSTAQEPPEKADSSPMPQMNGMPSSEIGLTGDAAAMAGADSPAADRAKRSQETINPRVLSSSQSDIEGATRSAKVMKTYSNRSRRTTPETRVVGQEFVGDEDEELPEPPTSEVLYPNGRAYEAATRTMSTKRKAETSEAPDEDATAAKVRKVSPIEDFSDAAEIEEGGEPVEAEDESDDGGPSQIPAGPKVSSGKLPRVARTDESDDDEIAVKPKKKSTRNKSSPEVVVRPQRSSKSASKTPAGTPGTPQSTATSSLSGKPPKILTSNYKPIAGLVKFLKAQGSTIIEVVPSRRTNFLCVVKEEQKLLRTPKVLRSLALGKQVVTERWITDSASAGELLDPADFVHKEVADTLEIDRRNLFFGKVLYFTNAAFKDYGKDIWEEMKMLATDAGASSVDHGTGGKGAQITGRNSIIYLGLPNDADVTVLIEEHSRVVYHKDLIKDAVISGELDLEDHQYMLTATKTKKGGRR